MDSYEEMIIPEVPKVLPNEQLFIYVPTASNENLGVAKFDNEHFSVDQDGTVHSMSIVKAGNITISKSQWTDATPTIAQFSISPLENGQALIIMPADDATKQAAVEARLSMYPNPFSSIGEHVVEFIRAEADDTPNIDMNFNYLVFKIKSADIAPSIALIGVDAYGECGGSASGVDESAVREIITAMLGNVANERQYSADNPPPYPVTSVNGKTGAVSLSATDVVADPAGTAQTLVDDLARKTAQDLANYYTKSQTMTKNEINALVSAIPKFKIEVVTSLPTSDISDTTVYLVKSGDDDTNLYTEYIRAGGNWEKLGTQTVDLTGYATEAWVNDILAAYVKTVDMETYVTGLLNAYQPAGDYLTPATGDQRYAKTSDIPTVPQTLPNPHALTIMGKTYNGSSAVSLTVDELIEAIKTASGGVVAWIGDDNNIYLTGNLTDGTYKAYYEDNGEYIEIGELTKGSVTPDPVTTNITLTDGIRIGSDGTDRTQAGYCATPHIDLTDIPKPCTIHLTKAYWCDNSKGNNMVRVHAANASSTKLINDITSEGVGGNYFTVVDNSGGIGNDVTVTVTSAEVATIRFSGLWTKAGVSDSTNSFAHAGTKATLTYTPAS